MDLFGYGGMDIDWDAIDWSSIFPDVTTTEQPKTAPAPVVQPQPVVQPVQQQEEIVSLASPFDADPFVPEAVAPQPTPAPAVQPEPTPAPVAQQQQQQPDLSIIPSGGLIPESVTALLPTIWSEEQQEFIPNPAKAALDASLTVEEVQSSFTQAQEEAEAKYASGELIRPPAGLDGGSSLFYNQANQLITQHGVPFEDAQNWLNSALKELEKVGTPDYDYNSIQQAQQQLIGESYLNTTNQWFSELDNLKTDNVSLFTEKYDDMPVQSRLQYLYHLYDEGELSEDKYKELFKTTLNSSYDKEKNPHGNIIIELEGQEFLVDGFNVQGVGPSDSFKNPTFLASSAYFADDSLYFPKDDSASGQAEFFKNIHRTGGKTRASDKVSDILEPSSWEWFLTNPVTNIAASIIPAGQLVLTGLKAATPDVDIDPLQAAGGLLQGLQMTGTIRPPATLPEGVVGPTDAGTGLFGTTYGQTEALVNAVATGDIKETAVGMFGGDLVNEGLAQAGIEASNLGLTPEQLESSIDTTVMAVAQGNELDEALARGFGQEVLEGVVGAIPETEVDFGVIEDTIKPIVETVIDTAETIAEPFIEVVKEAGPKVEDALRATGELVEPFVEPIIDVAETVGPEVEDVVRELGSTTDDVLIQPVVEAAETVGPEIENIIREVGSETEDIVKAVGSEVIDVVSPIGSAIEDIAKTTGSTVEDVLEGVGEITGEAVETVGEAIESGVETVGELIDPIGKAIEDIAKTTGSTVEDVLKGVGEITGEAVETVGEAISPIGEAIEDIAKTTGSTVEDVLKGVGEIGEGVVETVGEAIEAGVETVDELLSPIGSAVEDIARVTGSTVEDVLKGVGEIGEDITKEIGDVGQDVIDALSPIGSALEDVVKATGSNLEDLIKSLENTMSGAFGSLALQQQEQARQQRIQSALDTRTTDSLFGDELFQFQTEIAISPEYLTPVQAIEPPEEFVDILGNQDTGLDYNYILEDLTKPRSYSF